MMQVLLLGTGPASGVKGRGRTARTRSSALVSWKGFNLLIDCSPDFEKQIKREKIEKIDAVILTHAHRDATGGIGKLPPEVPIYAERQTIRQISRRFKTQRSSWYFLQPAKNVRIGPFSITPFRVLHSYPPKFPTLGFRVDGSFSKRTGFLSKREGLLVYASDVREIPKESWRFLKNADVLVLDAAFWFGYRLPNHFSIEEAIEIGKKAGAKKLVLTQIGNTYPPHERAEEEIKKYGSASLTTGGKNIILGYDGLKLTV
jgi:phosphoribosyl 1,2-cyclic phosphate phosphodiesterase